ncbi:MAG: hypothetical protein IK125_03180 [Lachnospiraceae bacterium]|nr:hypothetical protein [Lachnospiraceae bacterium]
MHNIKRRCALFGLALCMTFGMSGCDKKNSDEVVDLSNYLVTIDPEDKPKTSYETYTLEVSDYMKRSGAIATAKNNLTVVKVDIPYGNATPLGNVAANNTRVEAGAPLYRYRIDFDEVYMAEKRLQYTRKTERLEAYKVKEEKRLAEVLEAVAQLPADSEAFAEGLEDYQDQLKAYNEYVESEQEDIDERAKEIAAFEDNGKVFTVDAPVAGIATIYYRMYYFGDGTEIGAIRDPHTNIYAVSNDFNFLMVGQKVIGDYNELNGTKHEVEGRILSVDSVLPSNLQSDSAYIWFDFPEDLKETPESIHAVVVSESLKNIIRIPKDLVKLHEQSYYIEVLTDDGITRKNIDIFTEADLDYVVLDTSLAGLKVIKR